MLILLFILAGVYLALVVLVYLMQNRMVFLAEMPGRQLEANPGYVGFAYEDVWLTTTDNIRIHGWFIPAPEPRGTLLFFHGNAGNISHRLDSISIFRGLGLNSLIIDYRGYGQSEGKPSERGTYRDARAAWDYLVGELGVEPGEIIIFGRSLGAGVASSLAAMTTPAAVILESSFSSALDMAKRIYPFLPVRPLLSMRFPVADNVTKFSSPLLVIHSKDDEIIPFDMGQTVFDAALEPKQMLTIRGDHNSGFLLSRDIYMTTLSEFLTTHLAASQ
jgi:fermentation-respiration switch protein FrsA (DUF1100 family)